MVGLGISVRSSGGWLSRELSGRAARGMAGSGEVRVDSAAVDMFVSAKLYSDSS